MSFVVEVRPWWWSFRATEVWDAHVEVDVEPRTGEVARVDVEGIAVKGDPVWWRRRAGGNVQTSVRALANSGTFALG